MIYVDENNLLCNSEILSKDKNYTIKLSGNNFESFNKEIFVRHKKNIKIINLKDLGDKMEVFYIKNKKEENFSLNKNAFLKSAKLFNGFDENTGKQYFFLYKYSEKEMNKVQDILGKLKIHLPLIKESYGVIIENDNTNTTLSFSNKEEIISFLFGLVIFYGKIDINNHILKGIKINLPLWGQFNKYEEILDNIKEKLYQQGLFISTKIQKNGDISIYQINISDYEILEIIGEWYKNIEKINEINKHTQNQKAIEVLKSFLSNEKSFDIIQKQEIKLLIKE